MKTNRQIYCVGCQCKIEARLTDGGEIYPHRQDLKGLPFWKCDGCGNYVGCHHKTKDKTKPLGNIPTKELRNARQHIHKILDPMWQSGKFKRSQLYEAISAVVGWEYHTAQIKSVEEAREIYKFINRLRA